MGSAWLGRNSLPLWIPNEMVIDDDFTPAGLGYTYKTDQVTFNAGYFSNPAGMQHFSGNSAVAQVVFKAAIGDTKLVFAGGVVAFDADSDDPSNALLLENNGARDYTIWVGNAQASLRAMDKALRLNLDLIHNAEDYSASNPDEFTLLHHDQTDGFVVSARLGDTSACGTGLASTRCNSRELRFA